MMQSSNTISMLQSHSSSTDGFQSTNSQQHQQQQHSQQQQHRAGQTPRSMYNTQTGYRGTSAAPVQPYAFQSTPHLRQENRTISASNTQAQPSIANNIYNSTRQSFAAPNVVSTASSTASSSPSLTGRRSPSKDELFGGERPSSIISLSSSIPDLSLTNFDTTPKSSPDRYRRNPRRTDSNQSVTHAAQPSAAIPSGSGMSSVEHLYTPPPAPVMRTASDDLSSSKSSEAAKRYRRRSSGNMDTTSGSANAAPQPAQAPRPASSQGTTARQTTTSTIRPVSTHARTPSNESVQARGRATQQDAETVKGRTASPGSPSRQPRRDTSPAQKQARASADAHKRLTNPSPLSQSAYSRDEQAPSEPAMRANQASSPAAQHLAALSDRDLNKGMKSRLRRAFSFGTAAELRKASGENAPPQVRAGLQDKTAEELDEEQEAIARRQEAAGIGAGIYSGQGGFSGSTDNLSISSTASSASLMLRKMGKGMKKGGRSLKGLFRPKSVIGVPAADGPVQPSLAQVSMVTVEAERQKVNVNANPAEQVGGGTGFPKLERNSVEASHLGLDTRTSDERNDSMRKSIVGSEKERAEVLAVVKKGILKRAGTASPQGSPSIAAQNHGFSDAAQITLSPASSMPGTPKDERQSHSLTSTNSASSNDYFSSRQNGTAKSMPSTPSSSRNISFSPRIQFHDAWSSTEYDRRGDVATCNRLTPMLAQQIKEELNTFKMEMEVHEMSKPHTHFF